VSQFEVEVGRKRKKKKGEGIEYVDAFLTIDRSSSERNWSEWDGVK